MTATLERSLSRTSSVSMPLSPMISFRHEATTPISESSLSHIHERLSAIESRLLELRSTALTKDGYVDRRNREDEHIRREFEAHRSISNRIDLNVVALRADVGQLKSGILQLKSSLGQAGNETVFLRSDVDRLSKNVDQIQVDLEHMQTDVCGCRVEISKLQSAISQLRTELITLQHETSRHLNSFLERFSLIEARMKHSERVRFNSLAHTTHAPITPVPIVEEDGSLRWPDYFPRTVWRFWCLKKRSRHNRLAQLAEFYQLGGYEYWGRMHQTDGMFSDSDSSDSSDCPSNLTRAEAVRMFPEAAHQALAATLGLVYYKIRNEVGDHPLSPIQRPPKRHQEEVASVSSSSKQKPVKMARRPTNLSPTALHKLITGGPSLESKSLTSEESAKLGWNANATEISDDTMSKLRGIVSEEVGTILRALERGRLKIVPSRSERMEMSPTGSRSSSRNDKAPAVKDVEPTVPDTVPTEIISLSLRKDVQKAEVGIEPTIPDTASETTSVST
ncbi:hypothetical protein AN2692.2 [Aspergillus nidulans FGSC A4]|uniref:Uncharacterized protein n=1 Tax=Emericella nidulans (strain FGSC A4 / ATCC 38163 / CBS 112.46 / NRRL 194 / M139) TaxID=227321 RepID=Q5B9T8_EMENI|nr:protein mcnA [Aspergillus nidulans FGSC A4]EAA63094.1 hypothetical protein AN2692.2 [Aspergillus nidulans FGSC A4]CBF84200.1 TPA: conserved hypothetical protein [Aspergillus nidulans FGSC A4]|eukprot:XP_660296.1 hypothetical protein AN2692.2 [Aspergillus nidulans FGSC A4]